MMVFVYVRVKLKQIFNLFMIVWRMEFCDTVCPVLTLYYAV